MANNMTVLDALRAHRQEIGEEQQQAGALVAQCREEIEHRRVSLKSTQEQADDAAEEDEQLQAKHLALLEHYNGLREKPQGLLDEIINLQAEQSETARKRQQAADLFRQRHQALREAETRLALRERHFTLIRKSLREITAHILQVQGG
jgi:chromosome segregation ATPase